MHGLLLAHYCIHLSHMITHAFVIHLSHMCHRSEGFPPTGYFVLACVGSGRWADFESCSCIHACGFQCFCRKVWFRARGAHISWKSVVPCKRGTHFLEKYGFVQEGHTFIEKHGFVKEGYTANVFATSAEVADDAFPRSHTYDRGVS